VRRLFLDCEFTNFEAPSLISIGLVSEDDSLAFYGVRDDFDLGACSDFVQRVVLPILHQAVPGSAAAAGGVMPGPALGRALAGWLAAIPGAIEILYEADVDWILFCSLLEDAPEHIRGRLVRDDVAWIGTCEGQFAHHALHDARCLRFDWLQCGASNDLP
jgi:hypothetical protein